ncbi:hypothetical protein K435DRAFT_754968 [Dendrothele bispora CBS 962.96]|uniref:DASH complex subunit DAD3 n=1 Tax=Dendrothele bispora (strain CBS 962.96) TaxID=1314807 RepID=A0A4S8M389_DENBC|nr:hypothetical protein K435DRAFT_969436 [Dendrothele bispora CBS 962.96]THU96361.1 hypothetical protein K435DRAFT_754968 [Dendrothele bispora CBS 962.96]
MSSPIPTGNIFEENPYEGHPSLTTTQAEVLWEYAKLAQIVKLIVTKTRLLTEEPDEMLVARLRSLEKKMGLVLTLFKASVWGVINEQNDPSYGYENSGETTIQR